MPFNTANTLNRMVVYEPTLACATSHKQVWHPIYTL